MQFEAEAEDVSRMRREVPKKAAEAYAMVLEKEMQGEGGGVKVEEGVEDAGGTEELRGLGERGEEVERMFRRGKEGLDGLEGITGVIARLEQAGRAVEVVEGRA